MKILLLLCSFLTSLAVPVWLSDFEMAKMQANEKNQRILLNFSGSDWCAPCIRLKKEIFGSAAFQAYASEHLVLLNADFPRNKKNKLPKKQVQQNEELAEKYNPQGKFPLTLLLDANGQVLKSWEGLPNLTPKEFVDSLEQ